MNRTFNFNNVNRSLYHVTMKNNEMLVVKMPTTNIFEQFINFKNEEGNENNIEKLDSIISQILSNNLQGKIISKSEVNENFDLEEKVAFITDFAEFLSNALNVPN